MPRVESSWEMFHEVLEFGKLEMDQSESGRYTLKLPFNWRSILFFPIMNCQNEKYGTFVDICKCKNVDIFYLKTLLSDHFTSSERHWCPFLQYLQQWWWPGGPFWTDPEGPVWLPPTLLGQRLRHGQGLGQSQTALGAINSQLINNVEYIVEYIVED